MRWLKNLVPENTQATLNQNSGFQWLVIVVITVVGIFLVKNGIEGVRNKRLKGKNGRVFKGATAQILGIIYILLGIILPLTAIATKL